MASLELRGKTYRVVFRHLGDKYGYSLDTENRQTAEAFLGGVKKTLMLISQGLLEVPEGCDVVAFVRSGGKPIEPKKQPLEEITFAKLQEGYLAAISKGAVEENSLVTIKQHLAHLERTYGANFKLSKISFEELQRHVDRRLADTYRGKKIGPLTIRKEISAFRTMWNWGAVRKLVSGIFPSKGLLYPKTDEKAPFMTLEEIEQRIALGGYSDDEIKGLYESLYLRREEIDALLCFVREHAAYPWIFPLVATAAHTGARRSELVRIEVTDLNLKSGKLLIREKKRTKKQRTTRHVTLTPFLKQVLTEWMAIHPGGRYLFCQSGYVPHSSKRSEWTGYINGPGRPTTKVARKAILKRREPMGIAQLTCEELHHHLKQTLMGSRWEVVRGYHVLRHSFISCLAAAGVDQRIIDEFVGHSTDEQRRRYRHLIPDVKEKAISEAFG